MISLRPSLSSPQPPRRASQNRCNLPIDEVASSRNARGTKWLGRPGHAFLDLFATRNVEQFLRQRNG
jgi:hypothetical protein